MVSFLSIRHLLVNMMDVADLGRLRRPSSSHVHLDSELRVRIAFEGRRGGVIFP